ncbi:MAG TPA: hypothetical protein VLE44_00945 [Candidatus Saccharimonadales bacterium]|nr:hypothetical protein [Candidatus Saccharimonadales bacterium]
MGERIRIVDTPPGQAPEWVRKEWIGLELPVEDVDLEGGFSIGIKGGKPENLGGYPIRTEDAISALKEKSPKAANWWINNVPLDLVPRLVFKRDVCKVVPETPDNK